MIKRHNVLLRSAAPAALLLSLPLATPAAATPVGLTAAANVSVYATGFNNPRGLKFGPDGHLYVAEGGPGGSASTAGQCTQVVAPVGPYTGSSTGGRISKVVNGTRVTVTDQFPSSQTSPDLGNLVSGVADIAWIGNTLYAMTAGSGCSHGVANSVNGVFRVSGTGHISLVADLSAFLQANPVANPNPGDFEPDGTWWNMVAVRGALYAVEPNHGELDKITTSGQVSRVVDISASQGHIVPTALAYHGNFYVGNLNTFPIESGSARVLKINPNGNIQRVVSGVTSVLGIAFDNRDRMYVLENTDGQPFPTPGYGDVVRIDPSGKKTVVVENLALPTGITFGPDGAMYISNLGFGPPPSLPEGPGMVLRVTGF
jgi:sugar lactone lactonase YvrE